MVIVGGHDGVNFLSDVWECELNGLYWRQVGFTSLERKEQLARQLQESNGDAIELVESGANGAAAAITFSPSGKRTKLQEAADNVNREAATTIQAAARARQARVSTAWKLAAADLDYDAATFVQAMWRGWRARRRWGAATDAAAAGAH